MLPTVSFLQASDTYYPLSKMLTVTLGGFSSDGLNIFSRRMGVETSFAEHGALQLVQNSTLVEEGYQLDITLQGISLQASTDQGIIAGLTTLYQLTENVQGQMRIPCLTLTDAPQHSYRGIHLDSVRHFIPVDEILKILEQMSLVKLNVLHWVLTNDQAWRIPCPSFPLLTKDCAYYTQEEIRLVVREAALRGITVIPEMDMPGHMTALLSVYPEYSCTGERVKRAVTGGICPVILCAGQEKTYAMVEQLLRDVLPLFPGEYIHLGGDEAPKVRWKNCPHCQAMIHNLGLKNESELQGIFMNRVIALAKQHGKQVICWNESLTGGNLDPDAMVQYWTPDGASDTLKALKAGRKMIYSDMFTFYLDYPSVCIPLDRVYGDAAVMGETNVENEIFGLEACLWTEHLDTDEKRALHLFPRLYALAERAWAGSVSYPAFKENLQTFLGKFHPSDIPCQPAEEWEADMPDRIPRVLAHMNSITAAMSDEARESTMQAAAPSEEFRKRFASCFLGVKGGNLG